MICSGKYNGIWMSKGLEVLQYWWGKYLEDFQGQILMENGGSVGFVGLRSTFESLFCMQNHYQPPFSQAHYNCSKNLTQFTQMFCM